MRVVSTRSSVFLAQTNNEPDTGKTSFVSGFFDFYKNFSYNISEKTEVSKQNSIY